MVTDASCHRDTRQRVSFVEIQPRGRQWLFIRIVVLKFPELTPKYRLSGNGLSMPQGAMACIGRNAKAFWFHPGAVSSLKCNTEINELCWTEVKR